MKRLLFGFALFAGLGFGQGLPGELTQGNISFVYFTMTAPPIFVAPVAQPITWVWFKSSDPAVGNFKVTVRYRVNSATFSNSATVPKATTAYTMASFALDPTAIIQSVLIEEYKPTGSQEFVVAR